MNKFIPLLLFALSGAFVSAFLTVKPIETTAAFLAKDQVWQSFRERFPYHQQTIGMTPIQGDGSCVMLVSELPPHATLAGVKAIFEGQDIFFEEKKQVLGYDGWMKDLLIIVNDASRAEMSFLYEKLYQYLFFVKPKGQPLDLSSSEKPVFFTKENLNVQVTLAELQSWMLGDESEDFVAFDDTEGRELGISRILDKRLFGVYHSVSPGLVAWVLPMEADISTKQNEIRQFCENTDLIVGSFQTTEGIAIVGLQRALPESVLPVMRTETILALASTKSKWLGQSYPRTHPLAGKINENNDFAPIFLSNELLNTDFGGLLDLADQMLKSYSLNGLVKYANFDHPDPDHWAFPMPVDKVLNSGSTIFNFNTSGATQSANLGTYMVTSVSRTGALSVLYVPAKEKNRKINQDSVLICQKAAWDYFSSLGSPILAQVVRYAAMFQLLKQAGIKAAIPAYIQSRPLNVSHLQSETLRLFNAFGSLSDKEIDDLALKGVLKEVISQMVNKEITEKYKDLQEIERRKIFFKLFDEKFTEYIELVKKAKESPEEYNLSKKEIKQYVNDVNDAQREIRREIERFRNEIEEVKRIHGERGLRKFAQMLGDPGALHDLAPTAQDDPEIAKLLESVQEFARELERARSVRMLCDFLKIDIEQVQKKYCQQNENSGSAWLKTPTLVMSHEIDTAAIWTGGHNLGGGLIFNSGKTTRIVEIAKQPDGKSLIITIDESAWPRLTPEIAQSFKQKLSVVERNSEYRALKEEIREALEKSPVIPVRSREIVVPPTKFAKSEPESFFVIRKEADHTYIINGTKTEGCRDINMRVEKYLQENNLQYAKLKFENMAPDEANAVVAQAELRMSSKVKQTVRAYRPATEPQIRRAEYDFRNYKIREVSSEGEMLTLEIHIPLKAIPTGGALVQVKNVTKQWVQDVKKSIFSVFRIGRKSDIDILKEFKARLKTHGVNEEDISTELLDCFMCVRPDVHKQQNDGFLPIKLNNVTDYLPPQMPIGYRPSADGK